MEFGFSFKHKLKRNYKNKSGSYESLIPLSGDANIEGNVESPVSRMADRGQAVE
jgi:hypothetical protein